MEDEREGRKVGGREGGMQAGEAGMGGADASTGMVHTCSLRARVRPGLCECHVSVGEGACGGQGRPEFVMAGWLEGIGGVFQEPCGKDATSRGARVEPGSFALGAGKRHRGAGEAWGPEARGRTRTQSVLVTTCTSDGGRELDAGVAILIRYLPGCYKTPRRLYNCGSAV